MSVRHEKRHLTRSVLEGVSFGLNDSLELCEGPRRLTRGNHSFGRGDPFRSLEANACRRLLLPLFHGQRHRGGGLRGRRAGGSRMRGSSHGRVCLWRMDSENRVGGAWRAAWSLWQILLDLPFALPGPEGRLPVHLGILGRVGSGLRATSNPYESPDLLGEYMLFHYGSAADLMPWPAGPSEAAGFPVRTVSELIDPATLGEGARGLDVGCAVGRSTFELTSHCSQVKGIDFSDSFIRAANELLRKGSLSYRFRGRRLLPLRYGHRFACRGVEGRIRGRGCLRPPVRLGFLRRRACGQPSCRLPDPRLFLDRLGTLVKPGGQLLLTTPFTWLEEFTPRDHWLGSGDSEDALGRILEPSFAREHRKEIPFVIREHRRKFQYSVSLGSRWRRLQT